MTENRSVLVGPGDRFIQLYYPDGRLTACGDVPEDLLEVLLAGDLERGGVLVGSRYARYADDALKSGASRLREGDVEGALEAFRRAADQGVDRGRIAQRMLRIGSEDFQRQDRYRDAARIFEATVSFADEKDLRGAQHYQLAAAHFLSGVAIVRSNPHGDCGPARKALDRAQRFRTALQSAGGYDKEAIERLRHDIEALLKTQNHHVADSC